MKLLKLFSLLLDYPADDIWKHGDELLQAAQDSLLDAVQQQRLQGFIRELLASDSLDAQGEWIRTFDRGRAMSLLLFEHIHGESRDRGQAMVDLTEAYRKEGFELAAKELPDYLPLLLEFLSRQSAEQVADWLTHISHLLALLATRAEERNSRYQALFELLVVLSGEAQNWQSLRELVATEERDDSAAAMDQVWQEEQVRFGPDDGAGSACSSAASRSLNARTSQKRPNDPNRISTQQVS